MKDSPHYPQARVAVYLLMRAAGVPDAVASGLTDETLAHAARVAADYIGSAPVATEVRVTDHRGTRLAAESPKLGNGG